jgi:hypothetical protein
VRRPPGSFAFRKWLIAACVSLLTATHVAMTAIYLSPPNLLQQTVGEIVQDYMSPLFYQNWHLFSPRPGITSTKLAVRCHDADAGWTAWLDPLVTLYDEHYKYRVLGYGKVLYVYREIAIDLRQTLRVAQAECLERAADQPGREASCRDEEAVHRIRDSPPYELATRFAERTCRDWERVARLDDVQFKLLEFFPLKYSERHERDKRWSQVEEVVFPPLRRAPAD